MLLAQKLRMGKGRPQLAVVFSSNVTNQTVTASSLPGYVAGQSDVVITVNSGIYVYSTSTGTTGLTTAGFAAGDTCSLVNNGNIIGMGGDGGIGNSGTGSAGGNALNLGFPITITNGSGLIAGGGGGGGGGNFATGKVGAGGGGGGGGRTGLSNSAGGAGGSAVVPGTAGNPGTSSSAGTGGAGGNDGTGIGGNGGTGGDYGTAGSSGVSGGAGGAAGKAVNLNGHTITWISGNDGTHVKGAVS